MNIEELKLIADTITSLGASGKEAFIWWLVADKVLPVFAWLMVVCTLAFTAYKVIIKLNTPDVVDNRSRLERARDLIRHVWLYGDESYNGRNYDLYLMKEKLDEVVDGE